MATALANQLGWDIVHADQTLPADPVMHPFVDAPDIWDPPAEDLCALLARAATQSIPHLLSTVETHRLARGVVFEGERLHPSLLDHLAKDREVRGVFVFEANEQRLYETLMSRSRSFRSLDEPKRHKVAEVDRLFGLWLLQECEMSGHPCLPSQPWSTLAKRIGEVSRLRL